MPQPMPQALLHLMTQAKLHVKKVSLWNFSSLRKYSIALQISQFSQFSLSPVSHCFVPLAIFSRKIKRISLGLAALLLSGSANASEVKTAMQELANPAPRPHSISCELVLRGIARMSFTSQIRNQWQKLMSEPVEPVLSLTRRDEFLRELKEKKSLDGQNMRSTLDLVAALDAIGKFYDHDFLEWPENKIPSESDIGEMAPPKLPAAKALTSKELASRRKKYFRIVKEININEPLSVYQFNEILASLQMLKGESPQFLKRTWSSFWERNLGAPLEELIKRQNSVLAARQDIEASIQGPTPRFMSPEDLKWRPKIANEFRRFSNGNLQLLKFLLVNGASVYLAQRYFDSAPYFLIFFPTDFLKNRTKSSEELKMIFSGVSDYTTRKLRLIVPALGLAAFAASLFPNPIEKVTGVYEEAISNYRVVYGASIIDKPESKLDLELLKETTQTAGYHEWAKKFEKLQKRPPDVFNNVDDQNMWIKFVNEL